MALVLNPYLNFRDNAREAMEFYQEVFGGELTVGTFADFGASQDPGEDQLVMHADLQRADGIRFMGADTPHRMAYTPGTNFSMSLSGEDEAQLRGLYDKLAEGGAVIEPLERAPWGDLFGMCSDRFGITWLVNVNAQKD